ncbi:MAG TPA: antitoxin Xre/MbcA/ParS toxin-binding domain-containing protein [Ensifer sp.]|nr:antitoxin Xre/MbcA/ParS toxin-binding domain-containing protein [Ensifer sp.]
MNTREVVGSVSEEIGVATLFGGEKGLKHDVSSRIAVHELILTGIPGAALEQLVKQLPTISDDSDAFEKAFGMSERTYQRHKADKTKVLSPEQSSRTWNFARLLAKASAVLGSQAEAEAWMLQPALGLEGRRPIDLLATAAGSDLVREYLERLDYGVYA